MFFFDEAQVVLHRRGHRGRRRGAVVEDHHDIELQDETGRVLARRRVPEGIAGITTLHELIGEHSTGLEISPQVVVGIETDRGPWVQALLAAGYQVFAVNPMSVARYRERHAVSGAKSDPGDAHELEAGPGPARDRLSRQHQPPPLTEEINQTEPATYTENLSSVGGQQFAIDAAKAAYASTAPPPPGPATSPGPTLTPTQSPTDTPADPAVPHAVPNRRTPTFLATTEPSSPACTMASSMCSTTAWPWATTPTFQPCSRTSRATT